MKIICAGVMKTGTKSMAKALRHLGFKVFDWEEQTLDFLDHWLDVFQNVAALDAKRVYHNADAFVDFPGYFFVEEILEAFPDWKVILMVREEDSWVQSLSYHFETMYAKHDSKVAMFLSPTAKKMTYVVQSFLNAAIGASNSKYKSTCVFRKRYRIHNDRVKSIVPADKLLVYNVKQGWKPLCDFLECEVPTVAFPHENIKAEIFGTLPATRYGQQVKWEVHRGFFAIGSVLVIIVGTVLAICLM